ncbi:MAG: flippase-like domain-containing protein [Bryobacteraceae bacterium]|nr:flippase-like domain-containing protein [Bryobacteraceae bacterium]
MSIKIPRWTIPAAGYAVSLACLIWVYYGFDWKAELPKLMRTDWRWITVAVLADVLVYMVQGWRWSLLLRPLARVRLVKSIQAIYIGLFANEILPLRSGEVIRCYLLGRWSKLPFSVVVSSAVTERLFDGAWLVAGFYIVAQFVELPRVLMAASQILAGVLVAFGLLLAWAVLHKSHAKETMSRSRWSRVLHAVIDGLHSMGSSRSFAFSILVSFLYLALQIIPIFALVQGYGIDLSFWAAGVVLVILRLGSIPPQAPGNVGSFQFFTIVGLQLFGVDKMDATAFATLLFLVVTLPLWLAGFVALIATRMRLHEIHRDAHETMATHQGSPAAHPPASAT